MSEDEETLESTPIPKAEPVKEPSFLDKALNFGGLRNGDTQELLKMLKPATPPARPNMYGQMEQAPAPQPVQPAPMAAEGVLDVAVEQPAPKPIQPAPKAQTSSIQNPLVQEHITRLMQSQDAPLERKRDVLPERTGGFRRGLAGALSGLGATLQGGDAYGATSGALSDIDSRDDRAQALAKEEFFRDAGSDISARARQMLVEDFGVDEALVADMSAEDIANRIPTLKMRLDREFRDKEFGLKETALNQKEVNVSPKMTEGQKKVDQDYAKHYNEFSGGGASNAKNTISQLKELQQELIAEDEKLFGAGGGRVASLLPDAVRDKTSLKFKTEIPGKANLVLKKLFGGQLSDAERESEAKTYYNDMLGPKENADLLQKKIEQLEEQYNSEMAKAKYYEDNGTLNGFRINVGSADARGSAQEQETKTINGVTYRKVPGGWEAQ